MQKHQSYAKNGYLKENYKFFHLRDSLGNEKDYHFHEFNKIVIMMNGMATYQIDDVACAMEPGDIVLVNHHTMHKVEVDTHVEYDRIIIYLDPVFLERTFPGSELLRCFELAEREKRFLIRPTQEKNIYIRRLLAELETAMDDRRYGSDIMRITYIAQFVVELDRIMMSTSGQGQEKQNVDSKIQSVLSYINENLSEDLSVDALADRIYMSRYHFMRLFKSNTGYTVHDYIRQKRLIKASQLIRSGWTVTKAATECGFKDYSTFNRAFKEMFKITPASLKR